MKLEIKACNSLFFLVYFPDFKNIIFIKVHPPPSEVSGVKWANFESFWNKLPLVFWFKTIFVTSVTSKWAQPIFFKSHIFEIPRPNEEKWAISRLCCLKKSKSILKGGVFQLLPLVTRVWLNEDNQRKIIWDRLILLFEFPVLILLLKNYTLVAGKKRNTSLFFIQCSLFVE